MATQVFMPRQGNTVESCIIVSWKKREGDSIASGETLCEVETDKATFEVPAPEDGTVLKLLYKEGDDVPVLKLIAVIGRPGEDIGAFVGDSAGAPTTGGAAPGGAPASAATARGKGVEGAREPAPAAAASLGLVDLGASAPAGDGSAAPGREPSPSAGALSPRARHLAEREGLDAASLSGSGPRGRIIERDVRAALEGLPRLTPAARAAVDAAGAARPAEGSGLGGRVRARDVEELRARTPQAAGEVAAAPAGRAAPDAGGENRGTETAVRGVRKITAERMLASLQSTAQLTMDMSADATALLDFRARFKGAPAERGLSDVTINDMVMFAVARTLAGFPALNAHFLGDRILQFERVDLGFAVDTPRGLLVPVIRGAERRSLRELALEAKRLAAAGAAGTINPDELAGGTFTVSNLGAIGVERFTPVLNAPQVGILGVCAIQPKPVQQGGDVKFVPHLGLSLTIDHQAVDGAPAARFLAALCANIARFDLLLAE